MEEKTYKILSYCEIPEEIVESEDVLADAIHDSFIPWTVTSIADQEKYDYECFLLENWILDKYPEVSGETILIHIDY